MQQQADTVTQIADQQGSSTSDAGDPTGVTAQQAKAAAAAIVPDDSTSVTDNADRPQAVYLPFLKELIAPS